MSEQDNGGTNDFIDLTDVKEEEDKDQIEIDDDDDVITEKMVVDADKYSETEDEPTSEVNQPEPKPPEVQVKRIEGVECPICLEFTKYPFTTNCGHLFCRTCLEQYFENKTIKTCPICRKRIIKKSCHMIFL